MSAKLATIGAVDLSIRLVKLLTACLLFVIIAGFLLFFFFYFLKIPKLVSWHYLFVFIQIFFLFKKKNPKHYTTHSYSRMLFLLLVDEMTKYPVTLYMLFSIIPFRYTLMFRGCWIGDGGSAVAVMEVVIVFVGWWQQQQSKWRWQWHWQQESEQW